MDSGVRKLVAAFAVMLTCVACMLAQERYERKAAIRPKPVATCGNRTVALVVEPRLVRWIRNGLDQFEQDLCLGGYKTVEHNSGFTDAGQLRGYLQGIYNGGGGDLAGTILIGNIPHAYQWVTLVPTNPAFPPSAEEVISFQYYADLDGTFTKSASYSSPGGHQYSYDIHSGALGWEIWVGALPPYKGDLRRTAAAVNRYFAKNHAYRSGDLTLPNVFLEVNEHTVANTMSDYNSTMAQMRSGTYSWTPYSNSPGAHLYFDSPPAGLSVQQGYADLQSRIADFTVTDTHGSWAASGKLTINIVESKPVGTVFFWSNGCATGNLDHFPNFLSSVLYSSTSDVLIAKGTTNESGGMGNNGNGFFGHNIASALVSGASFGDAILGHVNVPLVAPWSQDREFHFASVVILGDPTLLRLSEGGADLIPFGRPEFPGPSGFCKIAQGGQHQGELIVTVTNRGNAAAAGSTTLVEFSDGSSFGLPTPAIAPGGSVDLPPLKIPAACFRPHCSFKITVDSKAQVQESNDTNNTAVGSCLG